MAMVGATLLTVRVKVVVATSPTLSVAVMVTVVEALGPSAGVYDQLQVPSVLFWVTVPTEAVSVTVPRPSASSKVPLLAAVELSVTITVAWLLAIVGGGLGWLISTWTLSLPVLAVARSSRPSPLKSPTARDSGPLPAP